MPSVRGIFYQNPINRDEGLWIQVADGRVIGLKERIAAVFQRTRDVGLGFA